MPEEVNNQQRQKLNVVMQASHPSYDGSRRRITNSRPAWMTEQDCVCVCVCAQGNVCVRACVSVECVFSTVHTWNPEENFVASAPSFHLYMGPRAHHTLTVLLTPKSEPEMETLFSCKLHKATAPTGKKLPSTIFTLLGRSSSSLFLFTIYVSVYSGATVLSDGLCGS